MYAVNVMLQECDHGAHHRLGSPRSRLGQCLLSTAGERASTTRCELDRPDMAQRVEHVPQRRHA
jgi:hypothetical protein